MSNKEAAPKVRIAPVTFVIEVTADKVSDKGTFSGLTVKSIKSTVKELQGFLRVAAPPQGGGSMYIKTDSMKGLDVQGDITAAKKTIKLF
jgi:hypothetical protein